MGLAAGAAVTVAVLAVAVSSYLGTRSDLLSQTDQSLTSLTNSALHRPAVPGGYVPGGGGPPGQGSGAGFFGGPGQSTGREGPGVGDDGLGLDQLHGPAFGGAPG